MSIKYHIRLITLIFLGLLCVNSTKSQDKTIEISSVRNDDNSVNINYIKRKPGSHTIKINFYDLTNTETLENYEKVINDGMGTLIRLRPIVNNKVINFRYTSSYTFGNNKPKIDSLFTYILPFKKGKNLKIYESSNMNEKYFGTEKDKSWKSYFVSSKTPDTVFSMRKGVVVDIINQYKTDTLVTGYIYSSKRNSITIEHKDGSYSSYKGLKLNSIPVKLGETVYPATVLGVLDLFNKKTYNLHFNIYYYGKPDYVYNAEATLKTAKSPYKYPSPYFFTATGISKVIPKQIMKLILVKI